MNHRIMDDGGTYTNEQGSRGSGLNIGGDDESARAFVIQVKEDVERCLQAGMSKEQMFQQLREMGLHPAVAFAVYKELRDQNNGFFREYHLKIDLRKQAERLKRLLHQYRTVRDAAAGARALPTATPLTAMAIPDVVGPPEHQTAPVGLDDAFLVGSGSGDRRFAGSAPLPPQTTTQALTGQLLHQREQPVPNGGVQELPSLACPSNAAMPAVSYPWSRDSVGMQWHGAQAEPPQQWWPGASVVPSQGFYSQPPLSRLVENRNRHEHVASRHDEHVESLQQWWPSTYRQPLSTIGSLRQYRNHHDHVASKFI